jgi:hypothetical protein
MTTAADRYHLITAEFTEDELKILDDCLHFTFSCLDRDSSINLAKDMGALIGKLKLFLPKRYVHPV